MRSAPASVPVTKPSQLATVPHAALVAVEAVVVMPPSKEPGGLLACLGKK